MARMEDTRPSVQTRTTCRIAPHQFDEHVHVIGHQHLGGVRRGGMSHRGLLETFQVEALIVLLKKDWLTIIPTLDDMLRDS